MARVKTKVEPATLAQTMNADGDRRAQMLSVASRFSGWRSPGGAEGRGRGSGG
jgi:hypothetical protein